MSEGPRTLHFRIFLNDRVLEKSLVRGPHISEGIHEQGCFALYCVSMDYKKLMFAVRIPVRGINPSTATKLRTPTFPGDLRFYIVILSGSPLSFRAKRGIWCRTPEPRTGMALQILHSAFAASMVTRRSRCRRVLYHIVLLNMVSVKVGLLPAMS